MPCGWEGNRRCGIALAMHHRIKWFIHLWAHGLDREMSTPPTLSSAVWPVYLYQMQIIATSPYQIPKAILGTSGHGSSMLMVAFDWQGMTYDFLLVFFSDLRSSLNYHRVTNTICYSL